jgi:hypothetical protein
MEVLLRMHKVNINANLNPEDIARIQIRKFIAEGIQDKKDDNLYDLEEVFNELEQRYDSAKL